MVVLVATVVVPVVVLKAAVQWVTFLFVLGRLGFRTGLGQLI
jgi:hypothetical protein